MERSFDQLESQLQDEIRKNTLLQNVSSELNELTPLDVKLNRILELLEKSFNLRHTMLLIPVKNNTALRVIASRGFPDPGKGVEVPFNYGIVGAVASKRKKLRVSRLSQYRRYAMAVGEEKAIDLKQGNLPGLVNSESQVALPLISNNELVAVLSCESEDVQFFHQSDEDFLMTLSQQIALSIQNSMVFEQLEERVKSRTIELERINAAKDRLFSIIGHDLRSPVAALGEVADLFKYYSSKGEKDKLDELGSKISHAAENVNHLLDNLLNWALSQRNGIRYLPEKITVQTIMDEVYQLYKDSIDSKDIEFIQGVNPNAGIYADYNMTFSILRNILSNAIKFTERNGRIDVSTRDDDNYLQIIIKDTGRGIDREKIRNLFILQEKQSTMGTEREKGSGLGLVLVNEFIQINKGKIAVDSSRDGTSIAISLPKSSS